MKLRKIFAAVMSAAMVLAISSCGKNQERQVPNITVAQPANGKKIIKIYSWLILDYKLYDSISDFNKRNTEYEIQLAEYNEGSYSDRITQLNLDITSGNIPDILVVEESMPVKSYIDKGLFADIYGFIDNDPDIKREDFLDSVFKAYERDGKLYEVVPEFSIGTVEGKTSLVGEKQGRTAEEFIALAEKYPDKKMMNGFTTKSGALDLLLRYSFARFADPSTGECSFNSEDFIKLLEFCNKFPLEEDENYFKNENWFSDEAADLLNGNTLFSATYVINNFRAIRRLEHTTFGEPITLMGYPEAGGNGSVIVPVAQYAVFDASPNKEGAWEFLKYFYSEEYQNAIVSSGYNFPVRLSSLALAAENAKKENNEIDYGANTDEDNQRIFDLLNSAAGGVIENDIIIFNIIEEETMTYFSGKKSAKEAAEVIQNRVQNYIDENR